MTSLAAAATEPIRLTDAERRAFRMGVLEAGAVYAPACEEACGCRARVENLRIAIAARGVAVEAPEFWPERAR